MRLADCRRLKTIILDQIKRDQFPVAIYFLMPGGTEVLSALDWKAVATNSRPSELDCTARMRRVAAVSKMGRRAIAYPSLRYKVSGMRGLIKGWRDTRDVLLQGAGIATAIRQVKKRHGII
jgi:hypothetical protein